MDTVFALVDCNNFYVSCERVFNPKLWGKPVIVMSNNDGCVIARSEEAKSLGVKMGMPVFQCEELIKKHGIYLFSSNYALYGDLSQRVMETLAQFSPEIEYYSIDEAFLSLTGFAYWNLTDYAKEIKKTVKQWIGIPVSIGIGRTKTLAKIANKLAKKNPDSGGILDLSGYSDPDPWLGKLDVGDIWGIGPQYSKFLHRHDIHTARDLKYAGDYWVKKNMTIMGLRTVWELRGISCIPLDEVPPPKKGILSSRSFGRPVESLTELKEALANYLSRATEKLRSQNSVASYLQVFVTTNRFKPGEKQYANALTVKLPIPTSSLPDLLVPAQNALEKIYKPGFRYKKTGIYLTGIIPKKEIPLALFHSSGSENRKNQLMKIMDGINSKWGKKTIQIASAGIDQPWQMRQFRKTPRYTTQWSEILAVANN